MRQLMSISTFVFLLKVRKIERASDGYPSEAPILVRSA